MIEQGALVAGDYGVRDGERWLAVVERKRLEDLIGSLSNGTLTFQLAAMAELPLAAVVVEGRYPKLRRALTSRCSSKLSGGTQSTCLDSIQPAM